MELGTNIFKEPEKDEYLLYHYTGLTFIPPKTKNLPHEFHTDEWWKKRHFDDPKVFSRAISAKAIGQPNLKTLFS